MSLPKIEEARFIASGNTTQLGLLNPSWVVSYKTINIKAGKQISVHDLCNFTYLFAILKCASEFRSCLGFGYANDHDEIMDAFVHDF